MKRILLIIAILFCTQGLWAQISIVEKLESRSLFGPKVKINQPEQLVKLMEKMSSADSENPMVEGFRVVVYSGNNSREALDAAKKMEARMRKEFPGAEVYVVFESPIRLCLYGDYRTREEAEAVMLQLKKTKKFKELYIKKCLINLPY